MNISGFVATNMIIYTGGTVSLLNMLLYVVGTIVIYGVYLRIGQWICNLK